MTDTTPTTAAVWFITGAARGMGIELAKDFGATESHKYVNGILDEVAKQHRRIERPA